MFWTRQPEPESAQAKPPDPGREARRKRASLICELDSWISAVQVAANVLLPDGDVPRSAGEKAEAEANAVLRIARGRLHELSKELKALGGEPNAGSQLPRAE